ncbi:hypothetical protein EZ456_15155 [Pedobacter psychrodurus]|uniref:Uncharacterized protein n=1 Tax=Pedobacter psychrodurus TaxID=2530456 RepID=A0A4V2MQQ8_9SPHI|nr:hypothetical protein [Pedobacter psychrodurus]TCD25594.1 hypothetical protein EZ456_15155 [Pedobacter psychrodurus]
MNFPLYIYYELLIRLSEIEPEIGHCVSSTANEGVYILRTTNGTVKVPLNFLKRQFEDPNLINKDELVELNKGFKPSYE